MRFHLGAVPKSSDFTPDASSWTPLSEPSPWLAQLIALPIGAIAVFLVTMLWFLITPLRDITPTVSLAAFLLSFAGIVVVHELTHVLVHPRAGRSANSIVGFWPSRVLFYAHYDGELSRNRFVGILLAPLAIISIVPLLIAAVAQIGSGWAAFVSAFNALLSCGDILGAGLVLSQIPSTQSVRNQGWRTYWKNGS